MKNKIQLFNLGLERTSSAKELKPKKEIKIGKHYKVIVKQNSNEKNEYFIHAFDSNDMIIRLSKIINLTNTFLKCTIEIEEV